MEKIKAWIKTYWQDYPHKYLVGMTLILLLMLLSVWLNLYPHQGQGGKETVQEAERLVLGLYDSKEEVFLRSDIQPSHINLARVALTRVPAHQKANLTKRLAEVETKYQIVDALNQVFNSQGHMLDGPEINQHAKLQDDLSPETLKEIKAKLPFNQLVQDEFVSLSQSLFDEASQTFEWVSQSQAQVADLPERLIAQEGFDSAFKQFLEVEAVVKKANKWGNVKEQVNQLEKKAKPYAEHILNAIPEDGYSQEELNKFFESPALTAHLTGSRIDTRKLVALTFDDGPFPSTTPVLLDILDKYGVKGTFFVMGSRSEFDPEILKDTYERGHRIGNHTYTHPDLANETDETVINQIAYAADAIKQVIGFEPDIYRMPFGSGGARVVNLLAPLESIVWNVDSEDWKTQDRDMIIEQVKTAIQPQSIILFHDTIYQTGEALEVLIPWMQEQGYHFVYADQINIGFDHY